MTCTRRLCPVHCSITRPASGPDGRGTEELSRRSAITFFTAESPAERAALSRGCAPLNTTLTEPVERQEARALIAQLLGGHVKIRQESEAVYARLGMDGGVLLAVAGDSNKITGFTCGSGGTCLVLFATAATPHNVIAGLHSSPTLLRAADAIDPRAPPGEPQRRARSARAHRDFLPTPAKTIPRPLRADPF